MELLLDDKWIEHTAGVRRVLGQPVKEPQPVLVADRPWEAYDMHGFHSVLWDAEEAKFKLWYRARTPRRANSDAVADKSTESSEREHSEFQNFLCYTESVDGVTWTKPALGRYEFAGSRENNILRTVGALWLLGG